MNDLETINNAVTMSSKEIATLTGKDHCHVLRDIRTMLSELYELKDDSELDHKEIQGVAVERDNRNYIVTIRLDKSHSLNLVTGYSAKLRMMVIKRWQELEVKIEQPVPTLSSPEITASLALEGHLRTANLFACPLHLAQVECVKLIRETHGIDFSSHLLMAPAQQNIAKQDVMLEPSEIGEEFGMSAREVNQALANAGLQIKSGNSWMPSEKGEPMCARHHWIKGNKSGYNLKWNMDLLQSALNVHH